MKYHVDSTILRPLVINSSGNIFVSSKIVSTIQSCIKSSPDEVRNQIDYLKKEYDSQQNHSRIKINYDNPSLLDAYSIQYLPRNTLVPKLALLCCSYHSSMLSISDRLNVLDLGSGTGGISLGLLDLFRQPQLDHIKCDIYAIDSSKISLSKQNQLINNYGLNGSTHKSDIADLTVPATYQKSLSEKSPFDFIFCANVLSEMNLAYVKNVLELIHDNLDEDGICIIAESQNTPAKTACAYLSRHVKEYGLHVFYPCIPNVECKQSECWKWFNHYFDCDDVLIGDDCFEIMKIHKVIWRILVKKPLSIYDYLNKRKNGLNWGVVRHNNGAEWDEFCTQKGQRNGIISPKLPSKVDQSPWSHIIGISADDQKVLSEWNPVDDFSNRNCKIEAIED